MKTLKKSELTEQTVQCLNGVELESAKLALTTNQEFLCEQFESLRKKEEWQEEEIEFLRLFLTQVAFCYQPSATAQMRESQAHAEKALQGILSANLKANTQEPWVASGAQYIKLSEKSLHYLRQVYPEIYLKRHKDPKFQQVVDAMPYIQGSEEVMGWFVGRIVSVSGGHKKLRQALEVDLKAGGLKLVESERSYGIVSADIDAEDETKMAARADELVKKGGQS